MKQSRVLLLLISAFLSLVPVSASAKTPVLNSISPSSTAAGTASFQMALTGSNFTSNCVVTWNGSQLVTIVVSSRQLQATIPAGAVANAGTYSVAVLNTRTRATSNGLPFVVDGPLATPTPSVSVSISPATATLQAGGSKQFTAAVSGTTNTAVTWSATGGTISSGGLYTAPSTAGSYTVTATSVTDSTKSASATVSVTASAACVLGSTIWTSNGLGISETGSFSADFDAIPQANAIDANVALSQNTPAAYTDLAVVVRFNSSGNIDVRDGASYMAAYTQPYSANSTYHFVLSVDVPSHVYSVYVTPPGGTQQVLASNYAFRSEQATDTSLNYWTTYEDPASAAAVQTCNFSLTTAPASAVSVSISPTSASLPTGGTQQFNVAVSGTTNTGVTWSATGGTISSSGLYTAPSAAGTYTVTATSVADTAKSASATVTVAASTVNHYVTLNWVASSSNVAAYNVYRASQSGGPYSLLSSWLTALTYTDINVSSGTTYYYVVTAVTSDGGESAYSQQAVATIPTP